MPLVANRQLTAAVVLGASIIATGIATATTSPAPAGLLSVDVAEDFIATGIATATTSPAPAGLLSVDVAEDFAYTVSLGDQVWLVSSPVRAYFEHTEYPNPTKDGRSVTSSGSDELECV